jgi:putative exporter of polyketide antibiotics
LAPFLFWDGANFFVSAPILKSGELCHRVLPTVSLQLEFCSSKVIAEMYSPSVFIKLYDSFGKKSSVLSHHVALPGERALTGVKSNSGPKESLDLGKLESLLWTMGLIIIISTAIMDRMAG